MNCLALIPARSGSKGITDKNLQEIGGHSLMEWSIKAALRTPSITNTIVSTDTKVYADHAMSCGAQVPFLRPKIISKDNSTDYEFILHALDNIDSPTEIPDYIIHLRPTTPLRNPLLLEKAINEFTSQGNDFTSLRSVHPDSESAYKSTEIDKSGVLTTVFTHSSDLDSINSARQTYPRTFTANGYIDIINVRFVRSESKLHGNRVMPFITPHVIEIDSFSDLQLARSYLKMNPDLKHSIF
ncbi:cytidylyltransferase domain-containing protein [Synechococcus sp. UW179B]|uniref:acylneuraminate cytidylyltransferase family protein n=1 Tax=Synechococcus sp. UW179B TaxID=2575516 RepID=UPI000E0E671B|nr:acylneuraminate cytidylyltransferase family protein [Synechococcus sp. UW179B]